MQETVQFVLRHGYAIVFAAVLAEQLGLPLPSGPVLLAMGALAGTGHFSLSLTLLLAVIASVAADTVWYWLGRRRGYKILNLLCRISLEPDSCSTTGAGHWPGRARSPGWASSSVRSSNAWPSAR